MSKARYAALALLIAIGVGRAGAAQFTYDGKFNSIQMTGQIEVGDAEKLVALLLVIAGQKDSVASFPSSLILDSGGGSVVEAAKIASLVEKLRFRSSVRGVGFQKGKQPGICASACFLVWLGGYWRHAAGYHVTSGNKLVDAAFDVNQRGAGWVGLHRPFLNLSESESTNMAESQRLQRQAMGELRRYLEDRNVPLDLIGKMMAQSSKNIYWLRPSEVISLRLSPEHEELLASNCDYRNTIITEESSSDELRAFLHESSPPVQEKLQACEQALVERLREQEIPEFLATLISGARPWTKAVR